MTAADTVTGRYADGLSRHSSEQAPVAAVKDLGRLTPAGLGPLASVAAGQSSRPGFPAVPA